MIEVETPQEIEVVSNGIDVEARSLDVEVVDLKELDVTVAKKEFVITGDDIYVPKLYDDAPQWMKDLVQIVVNSAVETNNMALISEINSTLSQFATSYVPLNQYTQSILDLSNEDVRINTVIETLNSNYNDGISNTNAQILNLENTKASKDEVVAQIVTTLSAQLANPTSDLGATIGRIDQTIVNNQEANALSMEVLTASLESVSGEIVANAEVVNNVLAYVGIDEAGASTNTGLSAYLEGNDGNFGSAGSQINNDIKVTAEGVESKWAYNSTVNINGVYKKSGFGLTTNYTSGRGTEVDPYVSEFWIDASRLKFTNSNKTGGTAPFTIDATGIQPQVTFNGKVTFGSGQTGTIDEAIAAVVETVAVGDKNINITDNLIPMTSLVADTDNSGYQFISTPTKSNAAGIDTYAEAQIVLDGSDEVYSPYVDDMTISYYYRFGIKGITSENVFKIVTINSSNVATSSTVTITMDSGQSITAGNWYIIEGMINPTGGSTAAVGSIRNSSGIKIGTVSSFVMPSGTSKLVLGWVASCTISRVKLCKVTADTVTSDLTTVNGQLATLQTNIDNVSWSSLQGKDLMAQQQGFANYADMTSKYSALGKTIINGGYINTGLVNANSITVGSLSADRLSSTNGTSTVWTGGGLISQNFNGNVNGAIGSPTQGFRLSSNATGTSTDPNIYGAYIKGGTIEGVSLSGTSLAVNDIKVRAEGYPSNFGPLRITSKAHDSGGIQTSVNTSTFRNRGYSSGYLVERMCPVNLTFKISALWIGTGVSGTGTIKVYANVGGISTLIATDATYGITSIYTTYTVTTTSDVYFTVQRQETTNNTLYISIEAEAENYG